MKIKNFWAGLCALATFTFASAHGAPVDLADWIAEGDGDWQLEDSNNTARQNINGNPTVLHNDTNSQGQQLSGTIQVQTDVDDDFIGFVLGYKSGDLTNPNPDYLLIDWKQNSQNIPSQNCTIGAGLSISRITGDIGDFSGIACRDNGVSELQRGATLGDTGWEDGVIYTFDLIFTATLVQVFVNGILEINLLGDFADGAFGFYNASQEQVVYAGLTEDVANIPIPAAAPLMVTALGIGSAFLRRRRRQN